MEQKNDVKVAAVVVTYNRLDMLKDCISAIRKQTYNNVDLIIVNNGSTDGTKDFLSLQTDLIVIHQDNCGGAGGFYAGMKYMYEHDYDALWMMDDDGIPDSRQLEFLISDSQQYGLGYSNALVINKNNHTETVIHTKYDKDKFDKKKIIYDQLNPFNGTLIWRYVIENVGFIKKEMFIWGDEVEYTSRVKAHNIKTGTITRAIHYHPEFKTTFFRVLPFLPKPRVAFKPKPKDKLYYRNLGYIDSKYHLYFLHKFVVYYLIRFRYNDLVYFLKYYRMGYKNDYSADLFNQRS